MSLDPKLLECIRSYRRRSALDRAALLTPFVVAIVLAAGLLLFSASSAWRLPGRITFDPLGEHYLAHQTILLVKVLAAGVIIALLAGFGYSIYAASRYAHGRFAWFVEQMTCEFDPAGMGKYQNAVQGAAIAAGVDAPVLDVLDEPQPNAVAYLDESDRRHIGATSGLLRADFAVDEADAIMAHELAHLIVGEHIRPPRLKDLEFMPSMLLVTYGIMGSAALLASPAILWYFVLILSSMALVFIFLVQIQRSERFILRQLDLAFQHDDELADSIAVKMTRDPDAMIRAIEKVRDLAGLTNRVAGGTILARYLFVTTPTATGDYYRFATRQASRMLADWKQPRTWFSSSRMITEAQHKLLKMEEREVRERLVNLDLIKQGHWRALGDWSK
ncbi:MAG: M48 family metalloprotease [Actinobacteria bacterium]|nr:M48 family metalloprotease [Actinomycetota bacterium]MBU1943348.1 M48 family metalloprotease [Actinomycetota bacterium]MBU2686534.1 M48 family metalloprotease [Actinomycetota bacterium]